jgi:aminoglycoside phosphotransferase (APT) family kinase protein
MLSPDTKPMRQGEELNEANLQAFLRENLDLKSDEIEILQFPAGSSNLTYLVKIDGEEFVLRRPPFGNTVKSAHDMKREFDVLGKLSKVYKPAPKPLVYCADENVVGSEFYLMERRKGLIIRGKSPPLPIISASGAYSRFDKPETSGKNKFHKLSARAFSFNSSISSDGFHLSPEFISSSKRFSFG